MASGSQGSRIVSTGSTGGWGSSGGSIAPAGSTGTSLLGGANSSLLTSQVPTNSLPPKSSPDSKVDASQLAGGAHSAQPSRRGKLNPSLLIASLVDLDDLSPAVGDDRNIASSKDDSSFEKDVQEKGLTQDQGHSGFAILTLEVTRDALVFINGRPTTTKGTRRIFASRKLSEDKKHEIKIRVQSKVGGEIVSQTKTIWLNHDQKRTLAFDFKPPTERIALR